MGRSFSAKDAEDILERQWKIKQYLAYVAASPEKYRCEVQVAADEIVMEEVLKALCEVPVDEIRTGQQGFRFGALVDRGFRTMADVAAVEAKELASACSISNASAQAIKKAVDDVIINTKKWVKVKIDADEKTDAATKLLAAVSRYSNCLPVAEKCQKLLDEYGSRIDSSIEQLDPSVSGMGWLFTSAKNRVKAEDAFTLLNDLFEGDYGKQAHAELFLFESLNKAEPREAWIEFLLSKDKFINTLKKTVPELLLEV